MDGVIRLDTHVVVWLYSGERERLSDAAATLIDEHVPVVSPTVQLELTYLHEIGRLTVGGGDILEDLGARIGLVRSDVPMAAVVQAAAALSWTRDPFDRMIVGDAIAAAATLVTKDDVIHANTTVAAW